MKIRNGFVSNSSTSSFIVRGIKIESSKLRSILNNENDDFNAVLNPLEEAGLGIYGRQYEDEPDQIVLGDSIMLVDNGEIAELETSTEKNDERLQKILYKFKIPGKLSTYVIRGV